MSRTPLEAAMGEDLGRWPAETAGCALVGPDGVVASAGSIDHVLPWASVTKIVAALAVLAVVHDGDLDLDDPSGPSGSTVRHLLGHASGLAFDSERVLAAPGTRRIYSNTGIDVVTRLAAARAGARDVATLLRTRVLEPLSMSTTFLLGPASHGGHGTVGDLALLARELLAPRTLPHGVVATAVAPSFPGLAGVLPGFGRQDPNDWGLGLERRGAKAPHWTPEGCSSSTFGHFGQAGAFLWVDPGSGLAGVAATGTQFGPWAAEAWPRDGGRWLRIWHDGRGPEERRTDGDQR